MTDSTLTVATGATAALVHSCFTVAQWQELEHQALIFKYLKAGLSVPPYLLLSVRKSFGLFSPPFFHTPTSTLNYYPYYGKKIDNEPGRCRRTDGKKWRCSKDAHPDSKYCERHMNRSRNRSRKPVESKTTPQLSISTVASSHVASGSSSPAVAYPKLSLSSRGNPEAPFYGSNMMRWQTESMPYGVALNSKECRSLNEPKSEADKQTFVPEAMRSERNLGINNITNDNWCLAPQMQEPRTGDLLLNRSSQLQGLQDFEPLTIGGAMSKQQQQQQQQQQNQQQQHYTFGKEFTSVGLMKHEYEDYQTLQPLFDEWPKCKDLDSFSDENTSKIQLSMGISMAPNSSVKSFLSQDDVCRENR